MSVRFDIDPRGLQRALSSYAVSRNKSDAEVVNKAMRYILPFAAKRVKDKTPGEMHIKMDLMEGARSKIGGPKRSQYTNKRAAAITAWRLRKRGQLVQLNAAIGPRASGKIQKSVRSDFYEKVRALVYAKQRSAHYLRAGFIPSFRVFNVPFRGAGKQRRFKGMSMGLKAKPSLRNVAEAYATNRREGAYKIAPRAFYEAARDTRRLFLQWVSEDLGRQAKRSGFY